VLVLAPPDGDALAVLIAHAESCGDCSHHRIWHPSVIEGGETGRSLAQGG
jgi:hypothetical protein